MHAFIKCFRVSAWVIACLQMSLAAHAIETIEPLQLSNGKSSVYTMAQNAVRISVGNPDIADVMLINAKEIYVLGKKVGTTNVIIWTQDGLTSMMDVTVSLDVKTLRGLMRELVPNETKVHVYALGETLVISGMVGDPIRLQRLVSLAEVYANGKKVMNMLRLEGSQQVMLEVKVAEVSKTLLNQLGGSVNGTRTNGVDTYTLLSAMLGTGGGSVSATDGRTTIKIDAEIKKGLVKILAEPTITSTSGQEGSFLAGGKIFIPVPQSSASGASTIALEEREFGVGLKFVPTVLEDGLINLRVTPEVSELSQVGTSVTTASGQVSVLPSITTRRASTTVQLRDGESFAIGGLIKNNVTEAVKAFPMLGEIPILGALFRSTAFQSERTELVFIVTPHLAKPSSQKMALPTDSFIEPTPRELHWEGQMEGAPKAPKAQP